MPRAQILTNINRHLQIHTRWATHLAQDRVHISIYHIHDTKQTTWLASIWLRDNDTSSIIISLNKREYPTPPSHILIPLADPDIYAKIDQVLAKCRR